MSDLLVFMYAALFVFCIAWIGQLGADPNSVRATASAIVMTISILLLVGFVALTLLNLILRAWGA